MRIMRHEYRVDWLHLAFVSIMAALVLWYLIDARSVSLSINNLLLVQPLAIAVFVLYLFIVPQCFRRADAAAEREAPAIDDPLQPKLPEGRALIRVAMLGAALGVFVFTLTTLGFDIGILLFALATMLICGERRPLPLVLYPLAVTVVSVYGFRALMPYPMVTALL
ncbi:tripartite tricarboxylate transporter TctB family protein [Antarcticirhabdus aurantiaca]|uniref:Tripartite tricarboxylate transporter TctB family protein n=1 Tax=Antarcticirhabdus aurantiaca TaxID=2606717 RepID=A0ACD4NV32_9HYPH|nr:tripartite tricarboxylate transporter TctB family protein [Antarcticirhabdus aurantiaca]WAJ30643.1 tripartite tricarboxylate transporter TctB family protein [Jeongeuplla avenae]